MAASVLFACPKGDTGTDRGTAIYHWPLRNVPRCPLYCQKHTTVTKRKLPYSRSDTVSNSFSMFLLQKPIAY